ncbi:MAG: CRISPR-associated endonuclease Cas1 [Longicatena sp.]
MYQSGTLKLENKSIVYILKNDKKLYIPIKQVYHLHIFGEVNLNKRILQQLNKENVTITFYNYYGTMIGNFIPSRCKSGKLMMEQVNAYQEKQCRHYIVRKMMDADIHQMIQVLLYYHKQGYDFIKQIECLRVCKQQINNLLLSNDDYVGKALMIEAKSKQIYYQVFDIVCSATKFRFERRSTQPPENEINAMMSYGYALLYSDILSHIQRSDLLSEISFIHSANSKQSTLQYDLADIFKPILIDRIVLRMIRRNQINLEDFLYRANGCFMSPEGCKKFVKEYDKQMKITVYDSRSKRKYSYQQLLKRDVYILRNYIEHKEEYRYHPYKAR